MNVPDRIYAQYRTKPKALAWYAITRIMSGSLVDTAELVRVMYDIDNATGEQLNIIGRIIVIDRNFFADIELFPGLFDLTDGDQFGDDEAMFSGLSVDEDSLMSDDLYRLAIKAKIIKNNGDATIESILQGMNFLLPNAGVLRVTDGEDMSFIIEFYGSITELQRWALLNANLIPKPQGVRFNGFLEGYQYAEFGDEELEFGDETAEFVGFIGA